MRTIFWNVDTQYDFMHPDGKLYVKDAEKIEENLAGLTNFAKKNNIVVVNTADWHNLNSEELSKNPDFIQTFPEHCMKNTKGGEFVPATNPKNPYKINWEQQGFDERELLQRRNIILYKDKFDVFSGNQNTDRIVKILRPTKAIVYGVATNVCVDYAVRGLLERAVWVYAIIDAMKELPGLPLPYDDWRKRGAILMTTDEVYTYVGGRE